MNIFVPTFSTSYKTCVSYEPSTLRIFCSHIRFLECLSLSRSLLENANRTNSFHASQSCVSSTGISTYTTKLRYSYSLIFLLAQLLSLRHVHHWKSISYDPRHHFPWFLVIWKAPDLLYTNKYPAILFSGTTLLHIVSSWMVYSLSSYPPKLYLPLKWPPHHLPTRQWPYT